MNMLTDDFPFLLPEHAGGDLTAKLRNLAADLDRVCAGVSPGVADLAEAPVIVGWRTVLSPVGLRLVGYVMDHPILGDRAAMTSQIWAADPAGQWIRTLSRFYRLGPSSETRSWS
jgi:hypothetical protein